MSYSFGLDVGAQASSSASTSETSEYAKYAKYMPTTGEGPKSAAGQAAVLALALGASAVLGPEAGLLVQWLGSGGGAWVTKQLSKINPWSKGKPYDWVSNVVVPVKDQVVKADQAVTAASAVAYRLLLEGKGLVRKGDPTPANLEWGAVRQHVAKFDPLVGSDDFGQYVFRLAAKNGCLSYQDVQVSSGRVSARFQLLDGGRCAERLTVMGLPYEGNLAFCNDLYNTRSDPTEGDINAVAAGMYDAWMAFRVAPHRAALEQALQTVDKALDSYLYVAAPKVQFRVGASLLPKATYSPAAKVVVVDSSNKAKAMALFAVAVGAAALAVYAYRRRRSRR